MKIEPCLIDAVNLKDSESSSIINVVMGRLSIVMNGPASDVFVNGSA